jgi:hypothetical protein
MKIAIALLLLSLTWGGSSACVLRHAPPSEYSWQNVTPAAAYPQGYNYPVFVQDGEMRALNHGGWVSTDGKQWTKTSLPDGGLNSTYQRYVFFNGAVYALGSMQGNYLDLKLSSRILRTQDFRNWETVAESSNLPPRIFYGAVVFRNEIWMVGGWDGKSYHNDVWTSRDGVNWTQAAAKTPWSPRTVSTVVAFHDRIWIIGGGVIDGEMDPNPNAGREIWSSADGTNWELMSPKFSDRPITVGAYSAAVFDGKLWLIGTNRGGSFQSGVWYSGDGVRWTQMTAPWSPRGGAAVWVAGDTLYMTGGKFSQTLNGKLEFVYRNDVWMMTRKSS